MSGVPCLTYNGHVLVVRVSDLLCLIYGDDGLVVSVCNVSRAEDPGFESRLRRDFFGVESYH